MELNNLVTLFENKMAALKTKKQLAIEKGLVELYEILDKEHLDTAATLYYIQKAIQDLKVYKDLEILDFLKRRLLDKLPNLALYFKKDSIEAVISQALDEAFSELLTEKFAKRIISVVPDDVSIGAADLEKEVSEPK